MIEVVINRGQYKALQHMLATIPKEIPKVITRALNKVAKAAYTRILRKITQEYAVTQGELKNRNLSLRRASYRNQVAYIKIKGRRVRLLAFRAKQVKKGVSYKIKKKGGRKRVYAFMQSPVGGAPTVMPTGHKGVFRRRSKARLPIIELFGPSIPAMFQTTPEFEHGRLERGLSGKLGKEIMNQAMYIISKRRGVSVRTG